jgi:hypothetical protein
MEREAATNLTVRPTRIAWIALLVVGLALAALLLFTLKPAHAATVVPGSTGFVPLDDEAEEESFEGEADSEEACLEAEEELDAGEINKEERDEFCEEAGGIVILPEECLVRTFLPQLVATGSKAQLTIRYTTYEPTKASVDYGLKGLHLGPAKIHFGQKGVLHLTKHLSDSQAAKVLEGHKAKVQIRVPSAPSSCNSAFSVQLTAHRDSPDRVTFAPKQKG